MTLHERIQDDLRAAMRSGDTLRRDVLRMATSAAYNVEKARGRPLTDEELVEVLAREVKTRRESVEAFRAGHREDLATKEESEIAILREFLPQPLSEAELIALVDAAVGATSAVAPRDLGRVMGWLAPRIKGRADGRQVSALVARRLAGGPVAGDGGVR